MRKALRLMLSGLIGMALASLPATMSASADDLPPIPSPDIDVTATPGPDLPVTTPGPDLPLATPSPDPTPATPSPVATPAPTPVEPQPAPRPSAHPTTGRTVRGTFFSPSMQQPRSYFIYLPPSYDQSPDRTYPVLYLLHGDAAPASAWVDMGLQSHVEAAITQRELSEMIVVAADGSGHHGDLTDWANRADGSDPVEDQVIDLVGYVDTTYRTLPDRSFRFIGGYSAGGFGALNIAIHHADLFSVAMSFSGFADAHDGAADPGVFGADEGYLGQNSPIDQLTTDAAHNLYYVLSAGQADGYFLSATRQFAGQLAAAGIGYELHVVPGNRDAQAWLAGLDEGLRYLANSTARLEGQTDQRQ